MLSLTHSLGWLGEWCRATKCFIFPVLFLVPVCLSAETVLPVLTTDKQLATAGYYQLSWQPGVAGASSKISYFELQQSSNRQFRLIKTVYRGPDHASVISGKPNGKYYYRVRTVFANQLSSGWSKPVLVEVRHHSLHKAWLFFSAGALVFLITLAFTVISSRRRKEV